MADPVYPGDTVLAGLIQAATAMEDEQTREQFTLGKRKRDEPLPDNGSTPDVVTLDDAPDPTLEVHATPLQHSASVLFREPSMKSKKHSRPPLGRVFSSLELAPENFLRLQTAAKSYMLDEAHPERRDVVGHKKNSGGSDLAKLNLYNCVDEFLSVQGYGAKYFSPGAGSEVPGAPQRSMFWPRDSQIIIKLMMPLMRKMVTNERQRVYAAVTRKQGATKENSEEQSPAPGDGALTAEERPPGASHLVTQVENDTSMPDQPDLPGSLPTASALSTSLPPQHDQQSITPSKSSVLLHVNVVSVKDGISKRVIPRFTLSPEVAPSLAALLDEVDKRHPLPDRHGTTSEGQGSHPVVKVWLTDGLVTVAADGEWMVALLSAGYVEWMDSEVRVLVEV